MALHDFIGRITKLTVSRKADFGYFLTDGEEDVLVHNNELQEELELDQEVDVFLYIDSQNRIAATSILPEITVGTYGWAQVSDVKPGIGVFMNIGIQKDMLLGEEDLPVHESVWPEVDDLLYITLRVNKNHRIYVKTATDPVISDISVKAEGSDFNKNIHGHIYRTAKVGSWIFTAEGFKGFIHESQRKREPRLGEKVEGRVIDVKDDGTINVSLIPRKQEALDEDSQIILSYLESRGGAMPYWDKSAPEDINDRFNLSKASFKRALGRLMKEGRVYQEEGWTYVKKENNEPS
ncbi:CvfB family protein [Cytobacillus gottheilii]|uniref:CvfB family protein n=1 Tax=Cytobacillus gottheilii TaxID=859144 RepID=UPI0009BB288C|nr:S1-like domain-containing RNA-binding protein [Cytobacillus gottheilii]